MNETGAHPVIGRSRIDLIPAKSRSFILSSNVSLYFFPGFVGIENLHRLCDTLCVPAEIFFIDDPFLVYHERHDTGISVLGRIRDYGKAEEHLCPLPHSCMPLLPHVFPGP